MPGVGEYRDRVTVLTRSLAPADSFGQEVESWPVPTGGAGRYWAKIEAPAGGEDPNTPRRATAAATLRFRGAAVIEAVDRVRIEATGEVYAVAGVWHERAEHGGRQTVCSLTGI